MMPMNCSKDFPRIATGLGIAREVVEEALEGFKEVERNVKKLSN